MNTFRISDCGFRNKRVNPNPQSAIRNPQSGFTLLEVMVAVAILALVLVTLIGVKNRSMQNVLLADHITTATMLAKREMIETLGDVATLGESEDDGGFPEDDFKDYKWARKISSVPVSDTVSITEVRVAVLWKEGVRQEKVELLSYE